YFPLTREQYRLSGRLFLISEPNSPLAPPVFPPWAPKDIQFEKERRRLWRKVSPSLRASFLSGIPGGKLKKSEDGGEVVERLDCYLEPEDEESMTTTSTSPLSASFAQTQPTDTPSHPPDTVENYPQPAPPTPQLRSLHATAFSHFGVLLLDVESVDHLDLGTSEGRGPGGIRTFYKMKVPERTFGRITGLTWEEKRVNP
ncbi:hypothetical protein HDV05_000554, partial [Chytridiales sp. JEL 0842]